MRKRHFRTEQIVVDAHRLHGKVQRLLDCIEAVPRFDQTLRGIFD